MDKNSDHQKRLEYLIGELKRTGSLNDNRVESAIRSIHRHEFVPNKLREKAYEDMPLPIMKDQTISQPTVVSRMTEWLDVRKGHKVLEIGTGSGWQTALLAYLVEDGKVYSIERHPELVEFSTENLNRLKIKNVEVVLGNGITGLPEKAPFNRIIITAACKKIPPQLLEQLEIDGLLIAPVGEYLQSLVLLKKTHQGIVEIKNHPGYLFVPLYDEPDSGKDYHD